MGDQLLKDLDALTEWIPWFSSATDSYMETMRQQLSKERAGIEEHLDHPRRDPVKRYVGAITTIPSSHPMSRVTLAAKAQRGANLLNALKG
jgi:hypothetical protein